MRTLLLILFLAFFIVLGSAFDMLVDWILWVGSVITGFFNPTNWNNLRVSLPWGIHVVALTMIGIFIAIVSVLVHSLRKEEGEETVWVG